MDHYGNGWLCISSTRNSCSGFKLGENANGIPPKESVTALVLEKEERNATKHLRSRTEISRVMDADGETVSADITLFDEHIIKLNSTA